MGEDQILDTGSEYAKEFYNDARDEQFVKYKNEYPPMLKAFSECPYMKSGKTPGPDITTQISALEECEIDQINVITSDGKEVY